MKSVHQTGGTPDCHQTVSLICDRLPVCLRELLFYWGSGNDKIDKRFNGSDAGVGNGNDDGFGGRTLGPSVFVVRLFCFCWSCSLFLIMYFAPAHDAIKFLSV